MSTLREITETRKASLSFLGLCFAQAWMYVVSQGVVCDSLAFQTSFHFGMFACLVVIALVTRCGGEISRRIGIIATLVLLVLPICGLASVPLQGFISVVIAFANGAAIAFVFASWFNVHCQLPERRAFVFILLGFSFGALLCFFLEAVSLFSDIGMLLLICGMPFGSLVTIRHSWRQIELKQDVVISGATAEAMLPDKRQIILLSLQVVLYAVIFGNGIIFSVLQESVAGSPRGDMAVFLNYALRFGFPLLMAVWVGLQKDGSLSVVRPVLNAVILILAFVLLLLWFVGGAGPTVAYSMVLLARNLVLILLYLTALKMVKIAGKKPFFVFGIARGLYELSVIVGIVGFRWMREAFADLLIGQSIVYATAFCVFFFLTSCFVATVQNLGSGRNGGEVTSGASSEMQQAAERADSDADLRAHLLSVYGFSEREADIAMMFSTGSSKKRIAQTYVLSENTVRWYIQQIYMKLGIHSRDELIEQLDQMRQK